MDEDPSLARRVGAADTSRRDTAAPVMHNRRDASLIRERSTAGRQVSGENANCAHSAIAGVVDFDQPRGGHGKLLTQVEDLVANAHVQLGVVWAT